MTRLELTLWSSALAVVVLVIAVVAVQSLHRRRTAPQEVPVPEPAPEPTPAAPAPREPLAAVVVNPSKFEDVGPLRAAATRVCADLGWAEPLWLETTAEDPGVGQTKEALDAGADVVVACGGDGTVRCVGEALAGTGTPMGLAPAGTGNLLARNLDVVTPRGAELSPDDVDAAMRVALTGQDRPVDVGWITVVGPGGDEHTAPDEQAFLVMAGMGFDAAIMANAPEALKARVGPIAYVVSGLQQLKGKRARVTIDVDGARHERRVRTVVVGNVGKLQGGLALLPDAEVDDGRLDVVAIGPRNLAEWAGVTGRVLTGRGRGADRIHHWSGKGIALRADTPQPAQLDGDPVGDAVELRMRVDEHALLVRVAPGVGAKP
ncbi:diacylglycerol kinase family protein [Quadrisphaera sp. DSM 44207]|uniref:diacylglycerol/lipid kinase family protein n=1 Tax=Quadrisphaera sp. DSM 44207 TaxID=1881057 RepID=UPI0008800102|nr:diacylglycerol kinase family protein [Quadrisphaera sp. DSM 44207]SDQ21975.1 Diacylglycerol kinase family enzyme [Quadrisphaera sp. DSM 44207]